MKKSIFYKGVLISLVMYCVPLVVHATGVVEQSAEKDESPCLLANVFVLIDKSKSMRMQESLQCKLSNTILEGLPINQQQVWFGSGVFGQTFSAPPFTHSPRMAHVQLDSLCCMPAYGEMTKLDSLELFTFKEFFSRVERARGQIVPNLLVIISDGDFSDSDATKAACVVLKEKFGIKILVIRIGLAGSENGAGNLYTIASDGDYYADGASEQILQAILGFSQCP